MKKLFWCSVVFVLVGGYFTATQPFDARLWWVSALSIVLFALPSFYFFCLELGWKRGVLILTVLSLYAFGFEYLAITTGFPYGRFSYTEKIGFRLGGQVPWTVAFAWVPLILASYGLAQRFVQVRWCQIVLSAIFLVLIDLVLDPGAVALKFWIWESNGPFYGVPVSNFVGWFLSGLVGSIILAKLLRGSIYGRSKYIKGIISSVVLIIIFWTTVVLVKGMFISVVIGLFLLGFIYSQSRNATDA